MTGSAVPPALGWLLRSPQPRPKKDGRRLFISILMSRHRGGLGHSDGDGVGEAADRLAVDLSDGWTSGGHGGCLGAEFYCVILQPEVYFWV